MYEFIKLNDEEDVEIEDLSIKYEDRTEQHQRQDYTNDSSIIISDEVIKEKAIFLNNDIFTFKGIYDRFFNKNIFEKTDEEDLKKYKCIIRCGALGSGEIYIGTNKDYRKQGYASLAVKYVVENKGGKYAQIYSGNTPSINLFKSLGFKIYIPKKDFTGAAGGNGTVIRAILPQFVDEVLGVRKKDWVEFTEEIGKSFDTEENEKGKYYENNDLIYNGQELDEEDKFYAQSVVIASAKGIDKRFFQDNFPFLKKVVIKENTLTTIPESFLSNKNYLENVIIESNVSKIGKDAFRSCHNLVSVKLPDSVIEIKNNAFVYCNNLKNINIPSSLKIIQTDVFTGCESLNKLILPIGIKEIKFDAFNRLRNFELIIPKRDNIKISSRLFGFRPEEGVKVITDDPKIKEYCKKNKIHCEYKGTAKDSKYIFTKIN